MVAIKEVAISFESGKTLEKHIVRWPGKVQPGTRSAAMLQYMDITPTLIDIAGGNPKNINTGSKDAYDNTGFDGMSFKKILTGKIIELDPFVPMQATTLK